MHDPQTTGPERCSSGIAGLDEVLHGGLIRRRAYLVSGAPGTGKTTLGWHFLAAGTALGERAIYVSFGEAEGQLRENAERTGIAAAGVEVIDLSPTSEDALRGDHYDVFAADEVERRPTLERLFAEIERIAPRRVFIDSMTHLRYVSSDGFTFRKQALSLLRHLSAAGIDVMVTSESSAALPDDDLRFLCDGVIELELDDDVRRLRVTKLRGSGFQGGRHTMRLTASGARVFPRLVPETYGLDFEQVTEPTGIAELDAMLGGGLERGSIALLSGPSGVGKTTVVMSMVKAAAERGERCAVYTFDERAATLARRSAGVGIPAQAYAERGLLELVEVEALRYTPDEFAGEVRAAVARGTRFVAIDSVSGYRLSVAHDGLERNLHALCRYLQNVGVTVVLVNELSDLTAFRISEIGVSYLADTVVFMRYFERRVGDALELRKAIGVLKKRYSDFEKTLRELTIAAGGVTVGGPLRALSGIVGTLPRDDAGATD